MSNIPNSKEIRDVVFSFGPYKSPKNDGLNALIFQSQWDKVGELVISFVKGVFLHPDNIKKANQTLICLIPKIDVPESLKDFRPISLCNVIYKTVTKIVANRLKSHLALLVMPNQCGFIKGRKRADNIIVAQEIIHFMNRKRGGKGWMTVKVDLEKSYDKISWEFLKDTLVDIEFSPNQGLHQEDPLSPYLFILCMERLAHLINVAVQEDVWKPIRLNRRGPLLSHLFFAGVLESSPGFLGDGMFAEECRGLGLRKIKENNMAFIIKLGHRIMTDRNSLWVRVLRSKYKVDERLIPNISASANDSGLWKTIVKIWPQTLENSHIILGDGVHTSFWMDLWVPGCPLLVSLAVQSIPPIMIHWSTSQFITCYGNWDWPLFQHSLPTSVLDKIRSVLPPTVDPSLDRVIWEGSQDGGFSVKSAYNYLMGTSHYHQDRIWKVIWAWPGPERIRQFLWLLYTGSLLTNVRRVHRHMATNVACLRCHYNHEDSLHAIRDCPGAREL
ncbi:uncharacterized protein LOC133306440 [Gastrolobium bilobum]|uniref:uncharacterized protein LOC133306440 n=1 Tax=Gastrolobium bilobum TaxID=150636 RepID=UPI002AB2E146|nr:uncharacterized protein LOC133306440 [Gastrolobium bilobum]